MKTLLPKISVVLAALLLSLAASAQADAPKEDITGKITGDGMTRLNIALPPSRADASTAAHAELIREVVGADLEFSGYFRLVDPKLWKGMDLGSPTIDYTSWKAMQADYLVLSIVSMQESQIVLEGRLYDIKTKTMITGKRLKSPVKEARSLAHHLSAVILDYLFGAGKFPISQILFTSRVGNTQDIYISDYDGDPKSVLRLTALGILNVTPDVNAEGSHIAFTSILRDRHELFLLDRTGKRTKVYGEGEGLNTSPKFSPDGSLLAFCSSRAENPDIWTVRPDGSGLKRVTTSWAIDTAPCWSPDGSRIAFTSDRSGRPLIYIMDKDGGNVRRLTPADSGRCDQGDWSPRGNKIAYATAVGAWFQIAVANLDTGEVEVITRGNYDNESPSWSPDGRYIAFASSRSGSFQVYIMRADGTGQTRITHQPDCYGPCWF